MTACLLTSRYVERGGTGGCLPGTPQGPLAPLLQLPTRAYGPCVLSLSLLINLSSTSCALHMRMHARPQAQVVASVRGDTRGLVEGWVELRGRGAGRQHGRVELRVQYRGYQ